jgi:hypothetical protein
MSGPFQQTAFLDILVHYANASGIALGGGGGLAQGVIYWGGRGLLYIKRVGHENEFKYFDKDGYF